MIIPINLTTSKMYTNTVGISVCATDIRIDFILMYEAQPQAAPIPLYFCHFQLNGQFNRYLCTPKFSLDISKGDSFCLYSYSEYISNTLLVKITISDLTNTASNSQAYELVVGHNRVA